jgi:hypothetical protein
LDGQLASADRFWDLRLQLGVRDTIPAMPALVVGVRRKYVACCGGLLCQFLSSLLLLQRFAVVPLFLFTRYAIVPLFLFTRFAVVPLFLLTRYAIVPLFLFTRYAIGTFA